MKIKKIFKELKNRLQYKNTCFNFAMSLAEG